MSRSRTPHKRKKLRHARPGFVAKPVVEPARLGMLRKMLEAQKRERLLIITAASRVKGLMPLLMKPRNGERWTPADRAELQEQFRALRHLSPYLVLLAMPGSVLMLPILAWWLDRRRAPRRSEPGIGRKNQS